MFWVLWVQVRLRKRMLHLEDLSSLLHELGSDPGAPDCLVS